MSAAATTAAPPTTAPVAAPVITARQRAIELGRPLALLALFVVAERAAGWWAAPLALVAVFAFALLVHDLIHNALHLPRAVNDVALAGFALFFLKSGHGLQATHARHHALCLRDADEEGRVAHASLARLVVTGPWLALRARATAFEHGARSRGWQAVETALDVALFAALAALAGWGGSRAALLYLLAVAAVTVTAPIWGAKIPHAVPEGNRAVDWLRARLGRWTPAASSVLFHELHHRAPRVPVALLAEKREEIERRPPSPCVDAGQRDEG